MIGLYIRVSTQEQVDEGYSISAQKERLTAYCQAQGWSNYRFYIDEGVSAKDTKRPELQRLFDDVKASRIDMILVYRLDRFTRKVIDFHNMLEEMKEYGCTFKSATEPYDTSSAMGRMFISLVATIAQWEAENLSERIKMALQEKVSKGERVGSVPYGFYLSEEETLVINEKSAVVLDIVDKIKSGWSMLRVADYLTKTNNDKPSWGANTIKRILTNPALYGATRWNDEIYENTHKGLVTKEEFNKIQSILQSRSKRRIRTAKSTYVFQGVVDCPNCARTLTVNRFVRKRVDGTQHVGVAYRCNHCIKDKTFTKSINENKILDALYKYMQNVTFDNIDIQPTEPTDNSKQLIAIERKREKFQRAWANDLMTDSEFEKLMNETKDIYEELKSEEDVNEPVVNLDDIKNIVFTFNDNFKLLTDEERKEFVARFIKSIEISVVENKPIRPDKSVRGDFHVVIDGVVFT